MRSLSYYRYWKFHFDCFKAQILVRKNLVSPPLGPSKVNPRRHKGGGGSIFLALNFCSLTDYQKLWHNCSLFVKTSWDSNQVTSRLMTSS